MVQQRKSSGTIRDLPDNLRILPVAPGRREQIREELEARTRLLEESSPIESPLSRAVQLSFEQALRNFAAHNVMPWADAFAGDALAAMLQHSMFPEQPAANEEVVEQLRRELAQERETNQREHQSVRAELRELKQQIAELQSSHSRIVLRPLVREEIASSPPVDLAEYSGEYVALANDVVIAHNQDYLALVRWLRESGVKDAYIVPVTPDEGTAR